MTDTVNPQPATPPFDDKLINDLLEWPEGNRFDRKRLAGKLTTVLETAVAFANTDGGIIALGLEDPDKAKGRDRVFGIQENPKVGTRARRYTKPNMPPPIQLFSTPEGKQRGQARQTP